MSPRTTVTRALRGAVCVGLGGVLLGALIGCTPPPPSVEQTTAPNAAACQKTGQQCRIGGTNALGVCYKDGPDGAWSCTPQH